MPKITNRRDDFLKPIYGDGEDCTKYPVINGRINYAKLDIIYIIPKAVPNTFFWTTSGMQATIQFAYKEYPIPINIKPIMAPSY
jgi:hypothetical protein